MYSFAELAVPVGTDFLPLFFGRVINALLALALYYRFGFGFEFIVGFVFVAALVVISFVDLNVRTVPGMVRLLGDWFRTLLFGQGFLLSNTRTESFPP